MEFLENLDFQKYRLDMESRAETCANRLSVQSYVGHTPQVFGPILPLVKVMVQKPDFCDIFQIFRENGPKIRFSDHNFV